MLNQVTLIGRMARDVVLQRTQNGTPYIRFTLAVSRTRGVNQITDYINCVAWRQTAEFIVRTSVKGSLLLVQGEINVNTYYDKNNQPRTNVDVTANNVLPLETKEQTDVRRAKLGIPVPEVNQYNIQNNHDRLASVANQAQTYNNNQVASLEPQNMNAQENVVEEFDGIIEETNPQTSTSSISIEELFYKDSVGSEGEE